MHTAESERSKSVALSLLASERPRNVGWISAAALLFGDWGTSRLYVLGLAFLVAGRSSFWLIGAMSLLILVVGWAYTHICRLYPDGGGVYTAGRRRIRILGVIGALLLFADYTITASLSSVEAFHYFGLGQHTAHVEQDTTDPGDHIELPHAEDTAIEKFWTLNSPGLWAIVAIMVLGAFNLMGPKHTAGFAIFAALGMVVITLLVVGAAVPQINWREVQWGRLVHPALPMWEGFVYIVLALSGVEAIANLTGVMRKPVFVTARRSIYIVAAEVALFNLLLAIVMISLASPAIATHEGVQMLSRESHKEDMLAYMAGAYIGAWGEWPVRILGGLLLLSATNTAVNGMMSITYVMSRDGELPQFLQKLNSFGAPWIGAIVAAIVPALVLLFFHDLQTLASLYAIGVVGAVAMNCLLAATHPRLRKMRRKLMIGALGIFLIAVWITIAFTKPPALIFVVIVLIIGLSLRALTQAHAKRRVRPSLLRQAILEQLPPEAMARPRLLVGTYGSESLAPAALQEAARDHAMLVVCFIRELALSYKHDSEVPMTIDTDPAAMKAFSRFLDLGHQMNVPVLPVYDTGPDAPLLLAENAAIHGCERILIGSSRQGALYHLIKGHFQRRLEALLPPEIRVDIITPTATEVATGHSADSTHH